MVFGEQMPEIDDPLSSSLVNTNFDSSETSDPDTNSEVDQAAFHQAIIGLYAGAVVSLPGFDRPSHESESSIHISNERMDVSTTSGGPDETSISSNEENGNGSSTKKTTLSKEALARVKRRLF